MKQSSNRRFLLSALTMMAVSVLAACAPTPPPAPPAPPPVPYRPYPPMGAAPNLTIPPAAADGTRLTINRGVSSKQAAWNLRSAYNVAALNCQKSRHAAILAEYSAFLKTHRSALTSINKSLDGEYKARHGRNYIREREAFQTQVYNYFALPPVMPSFCDATLSLGQDLRSVSPGQLESQAPSLLAKVDTVFNAFFDQYDQYRRDLANWEARYGSGASNAGGSSAGSPSQ